MYSRGRGRGTFRRINDKNGRGRPQAKESETETKLNNNGGFCSPAEVSRNRLNYESRNHPNLKTNDRKVKNVGPGTLQIWLKDYPSKVLSELIVDKYGFKEALNGAHFVRTYTRDVIQVIYRACSADQTKNGIKILMNIVRASKFIKDGFIHYYSKIFVNINIFLEDDEQLAFKNSFFIIKNLLELFPSCYEDLVPSLAVAEQIFRKLKTDQSFKCFQSNEHISDADLLYNEIKTLSDSLIDDVNKNVNILTNEIREPLVPPNSFRNMSVFPDVKNDLLIYEEPFLRPIEPKKKFEDLEQYLDIHFRLLKEDFVRPLRNGINEYLLLDDKHSLKQPKKKLFDIKVYQKVQILNPECSRNGILYRIIFDISKLQHVKWEYSKRFIYGSLLCFSHDNLKSIFIATVAERDTKLLSQGNLIVKFESNIRQLDNFTSLEFDMIETTAFFESYRHVLNALKSLDEQNFPFQKIIIKCEQIINPPNYVTQNNNLVFNFSDLFPSTSNVAKMVTVLDPNSWPSINDINFDNSQLEALKSALRSEVCLIQGPPGTGKTFIGLKIVQLLKTNWDVWNKNKTRPILVICYTNHALDQFLEGIAEFMTKDIVRIGGRSKSTKIENFFLKNIKRKIFSERKLPSDIFEGKRDARNKLSILESSIEEVSAKIKMLEKGIIHEDVIRPYMSPRHKAFFLHGNLFCKSLIPLWLELDCFCEEDALNDRMTNLSVNGEQVENEESCEENDDLIDMADEADLEELNRILELEDVDFIDKNKIKSKLLKQRAQIDAEKIIGHKFDVTEGEWKMSKKARKKFVKNIRNMLFSRDMMDETEANTITNVAHLDFKDKWRLYRYWINLYKKSLNDKIKEKEDEYQTLTDRITELVNEEDMWIIEQSKLIGMTTTGAARYSDVLRKIKPKIVIVEEAAEVLEAHITTNLTAGCEHLILIGDHKQLKPNPNVYRLAVDYNLNCSLFERLIINNIPHVTLEKQHRMRPQIADMARVIYPDLKDDDSVLAYEKIKGITTNVYLFNHKYPEQKNEELSSISNYFEANFLTKLCRYLIQQGYSPFQITVLTPYSGQMYCLKKCMPKKTFDGVKICPIDNYQGEENDIILLSMVRSNADDVIGFLKEDNRICVALTRAKKGFYVVGNFDMLRRESSLWKKILEVAAKHEPPFFGDTLSLACENHPNVSKTDIKCLEDFDKVPEGGCLINCDFRLKCGHVCSRVCHVQDKDHKLFKCMKICTKILCSNNHPCKKRCWEKCGKCMVPVSKIMPVCKHSQKVPCSTDVFDFTCNNACEKLLPCNHKCTNCCGDPCIKECRMQILKHLPCGHTVKVSCYENSETAKCTERCKVILECGHACEGTCWECFNGRVHKACAKSCNRILVCNHKCSNSCHESCPPCKNPCKTKCIHSKCPKTCGELCVNCSEKCEWKCKHFECTMLCHQPCNRQKCNKPCEKILPCKHPCVGLCGEKCPKLCRICNKEELTEIFFGHEDDESARFVVLDDCSHTLEVSGLDHWVNQSLSQGSAIKHLSCPKCKTHIPYNLRYGTEINTIFGKMQLIKSKTRGSDIEISTKQKMLLDKIRPGHATYKSILSGPSLTLSELISFETSFTFLEHSKKLLSSKFIIQEDDLKKLRSRLKKSLTFLSKQEIADIKMEITRFDLMLMFEECQNKFEKNRNPNLTNERKSVFQYTFSFLKRRKLDAEFEEKARCVLKETTKYLSGLGISEIERVQILRALPDVHKGAWFECPNGHQYAIGDCGGATEEGRCNECNSLIGGRNHALRTDNRWNNTMDGSTATSWPSTLMNP